MLHGDQLGINLPEFVTVVLLHLLILATARSLVSCQIRTPFVFLLMSFTYAWLVVF
jgi:hypothetical protein